ncbi:MAG: TSUP family transporter [Alphaproteobacteria bacterium]|nr:TSUP family transporter [Alphaproteobacteria bacterium]
MAELTIANLFNVALAIGAGVAMFNGMIHGYTGFGGALIIIPVLTFLFGPVEAIGMVMIITIFGAAQLARETVHLVRWRELVPICIGITAFTPVGAWFLYYIDPEIVRRSMGGFVVLFALILMSGWSYRGKRGALPSALVGMTAGGINGLTGVGGPPLGLYFLSSPLPVEVQRANIIMCIVVLIIAMMVAIAVGGGYSWLVVTRALLIVPAYMLGAWCGARLFALAPKSWFKKVALVILLITGISVLLA